MNNERQQQTETTRTQPSTTKNSKWTMKVYNKLKPREQNLLQRKTPDTHKVKSMEYQITKESMRAGIPKVLEKTS